MSNTKTDAVTEEAMLKVHEICAELISARLSEARELIDSAAECAFRCDYFQAAVRLEELKQIGAFTQTELNIFDAASRNAGLRTLP